MPRLAFVLTAVVLVLTAGLPAAAEDQEYLLVHDASAVIGVSTEVVAGALRAEAPAAVRAGWIATFEQALGASLAAGPGSPATGEPRRLTAAEAARWIEFNVRDLVTPTSLVRPAVRGVCVVGAAALHRRAADLLHALTVAAWSCHRFEVTLLGVEPAFLARLHAQAFVRLGEGSAPGFRLGEAEADAFEAGLASRKGYVDRGQAMLSLAWGEESRLTLARETTYAADVESHFAFGRQFGVPRPGVAEDGLRLRARVGDPLDDGVRLHLELNGSLLAGLDPFRTSIGGLEIPALVRTALVLDERLRPGEAFGVLGLVDPFAGGDPRGRTPSGTARQLLVVVRYRGKTAPRAASRADEIVARLVAEPGRALRAPALDEAPRTEIRDVRDVIVVDARDYGASLRTQREGAADPGAEEARSPEADAQAGLKAATERLAELVRAAVAPDYWASGRGGSLAPAAGGALAVVAPGEIQDRVLRFLEDVRELEKSAISTEVHLFGGRHDPESPRMTHVLPSLTQNRELKPEEVARLVQEAFKDVALRVIQAPRITTFQGQEASILVADQIAYLKDHEVLAGPTGVTLDPLIETTQEGVLLQIRAVSLPDGEWIRIEGTLEVAEIGEPLHRHPFGVPAGPDRGETSIALEMPVSRRVVHSFTDVVARGQGLFLAAPAWVRPLGPDRREPGEQEELYLLVRSGRINLAGVSTREGEGAEEKR